MMQKIVTVLITSLTVSCGFDPKMLLKPAEQLKTVVLASKHDLENNLVKTNSYMVAFRVDEVARTTFANYQSEFHAFYDLLSDSHLSDPRIVDMNHIAAVDLRAMKPQETGMNLNSVLELRLSEKPSSPLMASFSEVVFASQEEAKEVLEQWEREGRIWFADPNYTSKLDGIWADMQTKYTALKIDWHTQVHLTEAFGAIDSAPTDDEPIIAVMDSGIDTTHPNLTTRIWDNSGNQGEAGCGNDDINGCNTTKMQKGILGNGDISPAMIEELSTVCPDQKGNSGKCDGNCCHGTHVSGIIAAEPKENIGGVCPRCRIMGVKIVGNAPTGLSGEKGITILDTWIAAGMKYVAAFRRGSPVRVINASFGKFSRSRAVAALVSTLFETGKGTLVIGAAGNEDSLKIQYPAGYGDAIAVANLTSDNTKSFSSNFGSWVDIAAPGTAINSTVPGGGIEDKTGTSMASPVVSGIAGLILIKQPSISIKDLRATLINSADPSIYTNNINKDYLVSVPGEATSIPLLGTGLVNAKSAVDGIGSSDLPVVAVPDRVKPGCGTIAAGSSASFLALLLLFAVPCGTMLFRKKQLQQT